MAESPLECYREVIDPSIEEWPDFPAGHYNSKRQANIETDGEYLKPRGSRPGLSYDLYASGNSEYAQQALRYQSIEPTHKASSDVKNEDVTNVIDDVVDSN